MQLALLQPDAQLQTVMKQFKVRRFAKVRLEDYQVLNQNRSFVGLPGAESKIKLSFT